MLASRFAKLLQLLATAGEPITITRRVRAPRRPARNPEDPVQARRIQAAQEKRKRKALRRSVTAFSCSRLNRAHFELPGDGTLRVRRSLDPLYVNRG